VYENVYEYERERFTPILLPYSYTYSYTHISKYLARKRGQEIGVYE